MRRRIFGWAWPLALLGLAAQPTAAEDAPTRDTAVASLDALLEPVRARHDVPALTAIVISSRGTLARGTVGVRKRGAPTKVGADDLWHLGSCTKTMTATLIGRLVDQKKLRFDLTLGEAFPKLAKTMHADWKAVTLDLLLRNRSGMPADLGRDGLWGRLYAHQGAPREARRLLAATALTWKPRTKPGTAYEYSNAGFAIAGHVAETVLDTPYEALLVDVLLKPLGATPAGFGPPGPGGVTQPWGHRFTPAGRPPVDPATLGADNPPAITPAGRVHMTMDAWAHFVRLHLRGARPGKDTLLLKRETLQRLQSPRPKEDYAMGWVRLQRPWAGGPVLMHNGSNTMWFAVTWVAPKKDLAILVACNQGGGPGDKATDAATAACLRWWQGPAGRQAIERLR